MILAFDTFYFDNKAKTVCISFDNWTSENFISHSEIKENIADYIPGEFYKRELPCILSLLEKINLDTIEVIVVDGYVYLDDKLKLGLGGHLYKVLNEKIPVIGVAKSNFATIEINKKQLYRGESKNPLYITSIGIALEEAKEKIQSMKGNYRIPTLLKQLDSLTKE